MEQGLPESDSEQSNEGQLLHDYYAHPEYDRSFLKPNQRDLVDLADTLSGVVIKRCEEALMLLGPFIDIREMQLATNEGVYGTPDRLRNYYDKTVVIIDAKFGFNVVDRAEVNLQLRAYAVLGYDYARDAKQVVVSIVQPRTPYDERITMAVYTHEDIEAARKEIAFIIKHTEAVTMRLIPGEEQCRYCKAKLTCPAFRDEMTLPAVLTPDKALSKTARDAYLAQRLAELTDEQLVKAVLAIKLAGLVKSPTHEEVRKRIANGTITSLKVAKDSDVRKIADVRKALALLSLAGMSKDDIYDCVSEFAIGKLAEKLRGIHPNWTWKEANEWIDKKLASVIEHETRQGRLIPA
jgi:hypothetical protein